MELDCIEENGEFYDFLKQIIDMGRIDDPALGITKQIVGSGMNSLSERQKYVFDRCILKEYVVSSCARCRSNIPWCEMIDAYDNGGFCGWCDHMMNKDD